MSFLKDGIDAVDRLQREAYKEKKLKETIETKKLRERVQRDEQTAINKYHEGYCYGCSKIDKNLSTLFFSCGECMEKRGTEGLMCVVVKKHNWELCDICAKWNFDDTWQINASLCDSCMLRLRKIHKAYKKGGGRDKLAPDEKKKRRLFGKDYKEILGSGITRDQTRDQRFAKSGF